MILKCPVCNAKYYRRPSDGNSSDDCPECRDRRAVAKAKPATTMQTLTVRPTETAVKALIAELGGTAASAAMADIRQLARLSAAPIDTNRSFFQWLCNVDVVGNQLAKKSEYSTAATKLAQERTALINSLAQMAEAADRLSRTQQAIAVDRAKQEVEALQLENKRLALEEEIETRRALRERRLQTEALKEEQKQSEIRTTLQPTPPKPDPAAEALRGERRNLNARAKSQEVIVAGCLRRVRKLFESTRIDPNERCLRILSVIATFGLEREDLPKDIQAFLKREELEASMDV
jgi:hypothetical protein